MTNFTRESESGMGDVAVLLGWTQPPDDYGFWQRDDHGPVHDGNLRDYLVQEIAKMVSGMIRGNKRRLTQ